MKDIEKTAFCEWCKEQGRPIGESEAFAWFSALNWAKDKTKEQIDEEIKRLW